MQNIMVDLETLDTASSAVVLSIGAVAFDYEGNIGGALYLEFTNDLKAQVAAGRTLSPDTVLWWMQQNALARQVFSESPQNPMVRVSTVAGLDAFATFIKENGGDEALIWGNGSDFDNVILASLYRSFGKPLPWRYSNNRCFRTMKNQFQLLKPVVHNGVEHNALDDAMKQVKHLQEIYKCLATQ